MHTMSTNFAKTLVWKHGNDVRLWRHKQCTPKTNNHHMTLNQTLPWKFSAYATALQPNMHEKSTRVLNIFDEDSVLFSTFRSRLHLCCLHHGRAMCSEKTQNMMTHDCLRPTFQTGKFISCYVIGPFRSGFVHSSHFRQFCLPWGWKHDTKIKEFSIKTFSKFSHNSACGSSSGWFLQKLEIWLLVTKLQTATEQQFSAWMRKGYGNPGRVSF